MIVLPLTDGAIWQAADILRAGGTIIYPTETAYALGADPGNLQAVRKVFAIKGRDQKKPLGLVAGSLEQVQALCEIYPEEEKLARQYWPAALSIVLQLRSNPSTEWLRGLRLTTAGRDTVSIRVSPSTTVLELCTRFRFPIIATSANKSGKGEIFDPQTINRMFDHPPMPDLVLDGGTLPMSPMSTIVRVEDGEIKVLRHGAVKISNSK